jgi:tetratricopeptide (TPR) repeat protein
MACSSTYLGYIAFLLGQLAEARHYFHTSMTLGEEIGAEFIQINSRRWLGNVACRQQEYEAARRFFAESLALAVHRPTFAALALTGLGNVACALGDYSMARQHFRQALDILPTTGNVPDLLQTFAGVGQLWMQEGELDLAVQLLAFVQNHPSALLYTQNNVIELVAEVQPKLAEARFNIAWAAGKAMTLEDAIALTREVGGQ